MEPMEERALLSTVAHITNAIADNRGRVTLFFDTALNPETVNTSSILLFTAGPDGKLNTSDDIQEPISLSYDAAANKAVINANLPRNESYRVNVKGSLIQTADGGLLDGHFNGANATSGDGTPGSNYKFDAIKPTGPKVARFYTSVGSMNVQLYSAVDLPATIPNFLYYANTGAYDNTIIHRSTTVANTVSSEAPGYAIVQGGGYYVDSNDQIEQVPPTQGNIAQETTYPNAAGTLAMANEGQPDTTQNQWYFNVSDNQTAFGANYSVFGQITNSAGLAVLAQMDSYSTIDASSDTSIVSSTNQDLLTAFTNLPVTGAGVTTANLNLADDLLTINRVAVKMTLTASRMQTAAANAAPADAAPARSSESTAADAAVGGRTEYSAAGSTGTLFSSTPIAASSSDNLLGSASADLLG